MILTNGGPATESSQKFLQGMLDRMAVSFHKYGAVADAYPHTISARASLLRRLAEYDRTGNTEYLMDVANFAMIEFMHPQHHLAHYEPTDSDRSPGRVTTHGVPTHGPNLESRLKFYRRDGD